VASGFPRGDSHPLDEGGLARPQPGGLKFLIPHVERSDGRPATLELSEVEWHLLLDGIVVRDRVLLRRHSRTVPQATGGATMHGM